MDTNVVESTEIEATENEELATMPKWFVIKKSTISDLIKETLDVSMAYQRPSDVGIWKLAETKDKLIKSILLGRSIDAITLQDGQPRGAVNGKQRYNVIMLVFGGFYIPSTLTDYEDASGRVYKLSALNGKMFSQWPKVWQNRFLELLVAINEIDKNIDEDDISDYFSDMNQGSQKLSVAQANKSRLMPLYSKYEALSNAISALDTVNAKVKIDGNGILLHLISLASGHNDLSAKAVVNYALTSGSLFDSKMGIAAVKMLQAVVNELLADEGDRAIVKRFMKKIHIATLLHCLAAMPLDDTTVNTATLTTCLRYEFSHLNKNKTAAKIEYDKYTQNATADATKTDARIVAMKAMLNKPCWQAGVKAVESLAPDDGSKIIDVLSTQPKQNVIVLPRAESASKVQAEKLSAKAQRKAIRKAAYEASQKSSKMQPFAVDAWNEAATI